MAGCKPETVNPPGEKKVEHMKECAICGSLYEEGAEASVLNDAGQWLSAEVWQDAGTLCPGCLESRARLSMMYLVDR